MWEEVYRLKVRVFEKRRGRKIKLEKLRVEGYGRAKEATQVR